MRVFFLLLILLSCAGQAHAFSGDNCSIFWKAYLLPEEHSVTTDAFDTSASSPPLRKVLFALTVVPPAGGYLYGPDSPEGLPTSVEASYAILDAFPMAKLNAKDVEELLEDGGRSLQVRAPVASPKKETPFAGSILPGASDSNPPIYPGPVTFWTTASVPVSGLGGIVVKASMSGLLCTLSSCTPASGSLAVSLPAKDLGALASASAEPWWQDWKQGENVYIAPPAGAMHAEQTGSEEKSPFAGGKSLTSFSRSPSPSSPVLVEENPDDALARQAAFFSTLEPDPFNPDLEVQYLGEALLFGLAAGLLLNLMPCVLPVVSLKFSALMAVTAMEDKKKQAQAFRVHCLIFALGIMTWFLILAFLLGVAGWAWGEIFQQPGVIVVLGLVLFLLGLSLFGVYSLPIFDLKLAGEHHPHWQAFGSGLLATLLATPCSGPLLGGVLAWAIRQELPILTLTIASIGIGMSLPYGILAFNPRLVHLLPRPGAWTLRLEQLLGFFLLGSVVYLTSLLPPEWIPAFLFNLFAVALAAWLWGQIGHLRASRLRRGISRVLAVGVVLLATWWGSASLRAETSWESFEPERFIELLGKEPLLLEFTADWCPSCKALEHTTLNDKRMASLRGKYKLRTIKVDLTRNAEPGKELLRALDSTSIPVIALFPKGEGAKKPTVLRDLVTPTQLEEAAERTF